MPFKLSDTLPQLVSHACCTSSFLSRMVVILIFSIRSLRVL